MALERYVKPTEEKRVKPKRKKFWTKKKVLAMILVAVVLAGFYPLGHFPVWLLIYLSIVHRCNPIWVIQHQIRIQMEYRAALTRKIEVTIAKGDEVKEMTPSNVTEAIEIMKKYKENKLFQRMLKNEEVEKALFGESSTIQREVVFEGDTVECSHFLFFRKPLPVWMDDRVLAIKILVVNDYGMDWPGNLFHIDFILLKPIRVCGYHIREKRFITIEVQAVGYDTIAPRNYNATVFKTFATWECQFPNRTLIVINSPGSVHTFFYDFDQGKTYTLIVPFAELLKDNYIAGIRPSDMDIKVLEIGYVKP